MPVAGDVRLVASLMAPLRRHRAIAHLIIAATALAVVVGVAIPTAPVIQAGLQTEPRVASILPANVGVGLATTASVTLVFPGPMDRAAVAATLGLAPGTDVDLTWSADGRTLTVSPRQRWAPDERYVIHVPAGTAMADGGSLASDWRASFTTQTAPRVTKVHVEPVAGTVAANTPDVVEAGMAVLDGSAVGPDGAAADVTSDASAATALGLSFSAAMDHSSVEAAFRISPDVAGTFQWVGSTVWFVPDQRLDPGTRYSVTVAGARDTHGNRLGGDASFSLTTRPDAQALTVSPAIGARGVTANTVQIGFSLPMDQPRTESAFALVDVAAGQRVSGSLAWGADGLSLTFTPQAALRAGRTYEARLAAGAADVDGNPVTIAWRFTTAGGRSPARAFTPTPVTAGSSADVIYALNQVNAARAAYGLPPLALDAAISGVAQAHASDMLANGYFSHTSLDGTTFKQRLTAAGIPYGYSGENLCYLRYGGGVQATLDWCHSQFMAEPYPGYANHKANILSTHFRRVGIGIASGDGRVIVVWDFTD